MLRLIQEPIEQMQVAESLNHCLLEQRRESAKTLQTMLRNLTSNSNQKESNLLREKIAFDIKAYTREVYTLLT